MPPKPFTFSRTRVRVGLVSTHIAPARGYGGIAECTARVAAAWAAAGRSFALCASDASEDRPLRSDQVNLPAATPVRLYRAMLWPRWGLGLGALPAVFATCRQAEAVYVNGVGTWPTSLAGLTCRLLGRPYVVAAHGGLMPGHVEHIRKRKPLKWLFYKMITLPTLAKARAIHACSRLEADGVRALLPAAPVFVEANPIDMAEWPLSPPRSPDGGLVVAYVGRLSPEKGVLPFLQAWAAARGPRDRLLIAGGGGGRYAAQTAEAAAALGSAGAGPAVEIRGYLPADGVRALLAECDFAVLPSAMGSGGLRENFGVAVIEALAVGRPVLANRGMAWDDLEDLGAGLLFSPDAVGVRRVLERARRLTADDRAAMAAAGRRLVEERCASGMIADNIWRAVTGEA